MNIIRITSTQNRDSEIEDQAASWVVRLDGEALTDEEKDALRRWLKQDPRHEDALKSVAGTWLHMDELHGLLDLAGESAAVEAGAKKEDGFFPSGLAGKAFGFGLAVCLMLGFGYFLYPAFSGYTMVEEYGTAIGEVRSVVLPDGSNLSINTNTRVSVSYRRNIRLIRMQEGEAYFEVAHDPAKPFLVAVGKHVVRAVGTAFSIRATEKSVDVIVTDGRVRVSSFEEPIPASEDLNLEFNENVGSLVPLNQGQHGVFNETVGSLERLEEVQLDSVKKNLSWRDGMLIFDNDALSHVVNEISRYTSTRIVISDSRIQEMRFNGYFRVGDISAILATLENDFGIEVDQIEDNLIYLSSRD